MILRFPGRFLGGSDCNIMGLCLESRTVGSTVWLSESAPPGGYTGNVFAKKCCSFVAQRTAFGYSGPPEFREWY